MRTTTLLLPLAASLMLGTAALAQVPSSDSAQNSSMQNTGMINATADPKQNPKGGMAIDQETTVNGIPAACTGVSNETTDQSRWSQYPVKLVVSGTNHEYYSGEHVSITGKGGQPVADMTCNGSWVLMKLQPGAYHATVALPGHATKSVAFTAPARGQREVNVIFAENSRDMGAGHRATETDYRPPASGATLDNNANNTANATPSTTGNGAVDQPPQQPQK